MTLSAEDRRFLDLAIRLGARGAGRCWPNPSVGCVLVKAGVIVARAATAPGGRPHAEVQALQIAGNSAGGATAYVSLEPCAHDGATPPCARELASAGVARVVTALADPDPRTAGAGHALLRAAGVEVVPAAAEDAGREAHRGFLSRVQRGRPYLVLKLAASVDGRIATATGESRWITGASARKCVHGMRARADAVLVGGGTARADDPALTVREFGPVAQPVRVVASRHLDLPTGGSLAGTPGAGPLWLVHGPDATAPRRATWERAGARLLQASLGPGRQIDPLGMMEKLAAEGIGEVFCEGGGMLAASLLQAGLVDELVSFSAGLALGAEGQPALGPLGVDRLAEAPRFRLHRMEPVGADAMLVWRPEPTAEG